MRKRQWRSGVALACAAGCAAAFLLGAGAQAATLVEEGRPRAAVIVAPGLPAPTGDAVADLVRIVERMSGARLPVVASAADTDASARIWVGRHEGLERRFPGLDLSVPGFEEILIACRGEDVLLLGHDEAFDRPDGGRPLVRQAGTSLAVYEFLERALGVRWLWPGQLGEDVPESPTVRVAEFTHRHVPPRQRKLRIANHGRGVESYRGPRSREEVRALARQLDQGVSDWHRRQRASDYFRLMAAGHAFTRWWEMYGEAHPEYFALQPDGTRTPFPRPDRVKLCVSNPDVAEQWLQNAQRALDASPACMVVSASPNDSWNSGVCWCETCRSWDTPEAPPLRMPLRWRGHEEEYVALTDRYVRFWNILARGLRERLPGREAFVGVWAYGAYRPAPIRQRLEPNIMVGYVGWPGEDWQAWARQTRFLFWRPNLFHGSWGTPEVFVRRTGEAYALMADNLAGVDVDSVYNHWATHGLQYYALAQYNWDPRQDAEAMMAEYMARAFGEGAAPHMQAYFDAWETARVALNERTAGLHRTQAIMHFPEVYSADFLAEMGRHIENARAAVAGPRADLHRRRLDFIEAGLDFTRAQMGAVLAMADLRMGRGRTQEIIARAIEASDARDRILDEQMGTFALSALNEYHAQQRRGMRAYLGPPGDEYRALIEPEKGATPLPTQWQFLLDAENAGTHARWFDPDVARNLEWSYIQVTSPWGPQLPTEDPDDPPGTRVYHGVAWYRTTFEAEPVQPGEQVWLEFGAVDETCWVYLNGQEIGAQIYHALEDPDAWKKPRRFDVAGHLREGENDLVVKVQALAGQGGITRPVRLLRVAENLVPNGGFGDGMEGWGVALSTERFGEGLRERVSHGLVHGKYVEERSVEVNLERAPRRPDEGWPYAQLRRNVGQPLRQGVQYEVRVRFRQTVPTNLDVNDRPLRFRLYGRGDFDPEGRDRFWLHSAPHTSSDWDYLAGVFEAPRDYTHFTLTLMFGEPGMYLVDEFIVREYR